VPPTCDRKVLHVVDGGVPKLAPRRAARRRAQLIAG
jgi:hypothetical protein